MGPNLTQAEGFVLGLGAKMFIIAASILYGVIYYILQLF